MRYRFHRPASSLVLLVATSFVAIACGDDGGGYATEADRIGVGAECAEDADCLAPQSCLDQFKGGYCGVSDCADDLDCPEGSACVEHEDGTNYCFRICRDKGECNLNRGIDFASNCSANIDFVEASGIKACVPPSG